MISSADQFKKLRRSRSQDDQARATNDAAPISVWQEVIKKFPDLREWVAHNKRVPIEILEHLSNDSDARVRCVVASKNKLTSALRQKLAADVDATVRQRIVYNSKCEIELLRILADDPEPLVKTAAMMKLSERESKTTRKE